MTSRPVAMSLSHIWLIVLISSIIWLVLTALLVGLLDIAPSRTFIAALFTPVAIAWAYLTTLVVKRARS